METGVGNIAEAITSGTVSTGSVMEPNQTSPDVVANQSAETLHVATRMPNPTAPKTDPDQNTVTTLPPAKTAETKVLLVTCPQDGIILSQYPWKPKLAICMDHTPPVDIDIWCNKVRDYYVFTPTPTTNVTPVISDVKGYGLWKCPIKEKPSSEEQLQTETTATEQLIDHAKALINTAKTFVTKPANRKHISKGSSAPPVVTAGKSKPKIKALDLLQEQTLNNLATLQVGTDSSNKPSNVDPATPKHRKIKCKMCDEVFASVRELNVHHRNDHGIVNCTKCSKYFNTQSSLDKHLYSHREPKFNCELCGKCFPFESRLDQHMVIQKLPCPKKSCDKEFKSISDLNSHMNVHTKGGWYYCDQCNYKNKDKRNTNSHMRTHDKPEDSCYECGKRGKKMHSVCSSNDIMNRVVNCKMLFRSVFSFSVLNLNVAGRSILLHVGTAVLLKVESDCFCINC